MAKRSVDWSQAARSSVRATANAGSAREANIQAVKSRVAAAAATDEQLRRRLVAAGANELNATLRGALGEDFLPEGVSFRVLVEARDKAILVLPPLGAAQGSATSSDPIQALIGRAQNDRTFREALKADPRKAVEEHFLVALPSSFSVRVAEETKNRRYIVLGADFGHLRDQGVDGELLDLQANAAWCGNTCGFTLVTFVCKTSFFCTGPTHTEEDYPTCDTDTDPSRCQPTETQDPWPENG